MGKVFSRRGSVKLPTVLSVSQAGKGARRDASSRWSNVATVCAAVIALAALYATWYSFSQTFEQDRTKTALSFYSDYVKFVKDLESEPAKNDKAIAQCRALPYPVPQTRACIELLGWLEPVSLDTACGTTTSAGGKADAAADAASQAKSAAVPAGGASGVEMYTLPPMTGNSISYAMHLAEAIYELQEGDPGWRDTVATMVCDNAASIARGNNWRCSAMGSGFVTFAKRYSLLCCVREQVENECEQREVEATAATAAAAAAAAKAVPSALTAASAAAATASASMVPAALSASAPTTAAAPSAAATASSVAGK
jgi:hypothetical protein